jgi:hypothetical protein
LAEDVYAWQVKIKDGLTGWGKDGLQLCADNSRLRGKALQKGQYMRCNNAQVKGTDAKQS